LTRMASARFATTWTFAPSNSLYDHGCTRLVRTSYGRSFS
jgi:hypothetical protein